MTQLEHGDRIYPMTEIPKRKRLRRDAQKLGEMIHHYYPLTHAIDADPTHVRQLRDDIESAAAELLTGIESYEHSRRKPIFHKCEDACGHSFYAFAHAKATDDILNDMLNELKAALAKP